MSAALPDAREVWVKFGAWRSFAHGVRMSAGQSFQRQLWEFRDFRDLFRNMLHGPPNEATHKGQTPPLTINLPSPSMDIRLAPIRVRPSRDDL